MLRLGVVAFAAIFALNGCAGDDTFDDADAGGNSVDASAADASDATTAADTSSCFGPSCPCAPLSNYCAAYPSPPCDLNLDAVDDAATWGGTGHCQLYQSTNVCGGDIQIDVAGTDTGNLLFYDSTTRKLVGVAFFNNEMQTACWGSIPPTYCEDVLDGGACCEWNTGLLFDTFDSGVCYPLDNGQGDAD